MSSYRPLLRMAVLVLFLMGTGWNRNLSANETDANKGRLEPYARWIKTREGKALLDFVRTTVYTLVNHQTTESIAENLYPWIQYPVGVFITAMDKRKVRVCVGVFTPTEPTLGKEVIHQCNRLIIDDPRHPPLSPYELEQLRFVIAFTGDPTPIEKPEEIDIWRKGILMRWNGRESVLLPGEAKTLSWGLRELRRQIQIPTGEIAAYASFPVVTLEETEKKTTRE